VKHSVWRKSRLGPIVFMALQVGRKRSFSLPWARMSATLEERAKVYHTIFESKCSPQRSDDERPERRQCIGLNEATAALVYLRPLSRQDAGLKVAPRRGAWLWKWKSLQLFKKQQRALVCACLPELDPSCKRRQSGATQEPRANQEPERVCRNATSGLHAHSAKLNCFCSQF